MSSSVSPSEKYSCAGSADRFTNGRTAIDRIGFGFKVNSLAEKMLRQPKTNTPVITSTAAPAKIAIDGVSRFARGVEGIAEYGWGCGVICGTPAAALGASAALGSLRTDPVNR